MKIMKINNLVGISGKINSGKDLVGEMLTYIDSSNNPSYEDYTTYINLGSDIKIKKCAGKLKEIVAIIIGCTIKDLEDEVFKNTPLGEEWVKYQVDTTYVPHPLDSSSSEFYRGTKYFSTFKEANEYLEDEIKSCPNDAEVDGDVKKVELTARKILQLLGTEGGRNIIHPNIWVNSLFSEYKPFDKGKAHDGKTMHELYGNKTCQHCETKFNGYKRQWLCAECIKDDNIQIYPKWIITDVRFPENEGEAIKKRGGLLIGVKRQFNLRFPEYIGIAIEDRPYDIPKKLMALNLELYNSLMHASETSQGDYSWCDVIILNNGTIEDLFNQVLLTVRVKYRTI